MMDERDEKATGAVDENEPVKLSTLHAASTTKFSDTDSAESRKPVQHISDDQYPRGLKLVLLAGASIVAVFLIALDQVSTFPGDADVAERIANTEFV